MKKIYAIILLIIIVGTLIAGCNNKVTNETEDIQDSTIIIDTLKISDYFPLDGNVHKLYKGTGNEYAPFETYVDFVNDNTIQLRNLNGGTTTINVYKITDNALIKTFSQGESYFKFNYLNATNTNEILIQAPIEVGVTWTLDNGATRMITSIDTEILTPLGNFKALEVTTEYTDSTTKNYYVKDIGLVKTVFYTGNEENTITSEIKKIEKNAPYKDTIKIFYPDFTNDRIVYINKEISLDTNQDIIEILENELKLAPKDSELIASLSQNVSITGISLNTEDDIVTIDFSKELIPSMNAGSSLESMIIQSISNTIGNYFQKNKVIITIESKLYESGHIMLNEGDYFIPEFDGVVEYK